MMIVENTCTCVPVAIGKLRKADQLLLCKSSSNVNKICCQSCQPVHRTWSSDMFTCVELCCAHKKKVNLSDSSLKTVI